MGSLQQAVDIGHMIVLNDSSQLHATSLHCDNSFELFVVVAHLAMTCLLMAGCRSNGGSWCTGGSA